MRKSDFFETSVPKRLRPFFTIAKIYILFFIFASWSLPNALASHLPDGGHYRDEGLRISTFDIDVTPPVGYHLAYDPEINKWDLGLRAKGIVLLGVGEPIVLCAIDAIGISNQGHEDFRKALAFAAGTSKERVAVHALHQHDAPRYDPGGEKILLDAGIDPAGLNSTWGRETIDHLVKAISASLKSAQPVNYFGWGEAFVHEVASNRTVYRGADGKVIRPRFSSTGTDSLLRKLPVGTVDSTVTVVSFWNNDKPVAVLSFFATHPQSYYRTGVANPDFVGVARFFRQLAVPDALHIHFNGAGGNVAVGKYNDGSHINRLLLAERLADGMERAWKSTQRQTITAKDINWFVESVALRPNQKIYNLRNKIQMSEASVKNMSDAYDLAWLNQYEAGKKVDCAVLKIKNANLLFMPGELFVEYQIEAKKAGRNRLVAMSAYGDYGPGYIGTAEAYQYGGYETERGSNVTAEAEAVLMKAISNLLNK